MKKTLFISKTRILSTALIIASLTTFTYSISKADTEPPYEGRYSTGICGTYNPTTGETTWGAGCIYEDPDGNCRRESPCVPTY